MEHVECVVIGAGAVGLAVAAELAKTREVIVLEQAAEFGTGVSSRSSEVIHAGLYYPKDSLKYRFCIEGRNLLYAFCEKHNVACKKTGKYVVATTATEEQYLNQLYDNVHDSVPVKLLTPAQVCKTEPELKVIAALESPESGIFDSHGFMLANLGLLQQYGGSCVFNSNVTQISQETNHATVYVNGAPAITASLIINSAGISALDIAQQAGIPEEHIPGKRLVKGNYFELAGKSPFNRLIYPIPDQDGLGIHSTLDLSGKTRFGPDTIEVTELDYRVDPNLEEKFRGAVARYWPLVQNATLVPSYAGIRPKLYSNNLPGFSDFMCSKFTIGNTMYIGLYGIDSPGLTAALAIAQNVAEISQGVL